MIPVNLSIKLPRIDRFRSPYPIEMVSQLVVRNYNVPGSPFPARYRFAQVRLPGCKKGDLIEAVFNMQITNPLAYPVENAWSLRLTQSDTGFEGIHMRGGSRAYNITPSMHHGPADQTAQIDVPEDGDWWAIAMVYAGGGSQSQPGDIAVVDVGYGSFNVKRTRR